MTHPRSSPELEQLGAILTVVIGYQLAQSGEPSEAARALANSLMTRDSTLNQDLRALVGPRDSPTTLNDEPAAITTVLDAVLLARARFAGLLVLESAIDSAKKRGSLQARKTWEVLQALGEIAERYQADPDLDVDASLRTINGYRGDVSDTAKQKYPADYRRQLPDGREIVLGPHAPTGPGGRVYLAIDRDRRQIVIGHVGEHLRGKDRV